MLIKRKSRLVIIWSCILIAVVLILSLIGYYLFITWKEEEARKIYTLALRELNAKLFSKYVIITRTVAKIDEEGLLKGRPIVEGSIKNTSDKKITRLKIKIFFLDKDDSVVYMDSFYPLGLENYLFPNDSISFKHLLKKRPRVLDDYFAAQRSFAKVDDALKLTLRWQIEALDIR